MSANNVDLTAILPVLIEAVKPFAQIVDGYEGLPTASRPSDATPLRACFGGSRPALGDLRKLVQAVNAVRRMTGEKA